MKEVVRSLGHRGLTQREPGDRATVRVAHCGDVGAGNVEPLVLVIGEVDARERVVDDGAVSVMGMTLVDRVDFFIREPMPAVLDQCASDFTVEREVVVVGDDLSGALEGVCDGGASPEGVEHGRKIEAVECGENGEGGLALAALVARRGKPTESIGGVLGCGVE